MIVRETNEDSSAICDYTSKASASLLKLSKELPCICDGASQDQDALKGWGSVINETSSSNSSGSGGTPAVDRRRAPAARAPRRPFPYRLHQHGIPTPDGRSRYEYVFRHSKDAGSYMEQYRLEHTVMDTGRTMAKIQQAVEDLMVILPSMPSGSTTGSVQFRLPVVRHDRPATTGNHGGGDALQDLRIGKSRENTMIKPPPSPQRDRSALRKSQSTEAPKGGKGKRKARKLGSVDDRSVRSMEVDSDSGGTFVNIFGELGVPDVAGCRSLSNRLEGNSAKTDSTLADSSWLSYDRATFRTGSFGSMAPPSGGDGIIPEILKQPIRRFRRDDAVNEARPCEAWESLWRDNFRHFMEPRENSFKMEGALNERSRQRKLEKTHGKVKGLAKGVTFSKRNNLRDPPTDPQTKVTVSDYFDTSSLLQVNSFGYRTCDRHVTGKPRTPTSSGFQRRAPPPPLSGDTIVVGSPYGTEGQHLLDK